MCSQKKRITATRRAKTNPPPEAPAISAILERGNAFVVAFAEADGDDMLDRREFDAPVALDRLDVAIVFDVSVAMIDVAARMLGAVGRTVGVSATMLGAVGRMVGVSVAIDGMSATMSGVLTVVLGVLATTPSVLATMLGVVTALSDLVAAIISKVVGLAFCLEEGLVFVTIDSGARSRRGFRLCISCWSIREAKGRMSSSRQPSEHGFLIQHPTISVFESHTYHLAPGEHDR